MLANTNIELFNQTVMPAVEMFKLIGIKYIYMYTVIRRINYTTLNTHVLKSRLICYVLSN